MKIGILSFHNANNFGAVLQNYALQTWLKMNGHEVETIDYHCENLEKAYRNKPKIGKEMTKTEIWKSILVWCMNIYGLMRANRRFDAFRNQNINLSTATTRKDLHSRCGSSALRMNLKLFLRAVSFASSRNSSRRWEWRRLK